MRFIPAVMMLLSLAAAASNDVDVEADPAVHTLYPVCVHAHFYGCGLVNAAGNFVVEPRYERLLENGPFWTATRRSGLTGVLNALGQELAAPKFQSIGRFDGGLAPAALPGRRELSGYINPAGQWVIEPKFLYQRAFSGAAAVAWLGPDFDSRKLVLLKRDGTTTPLPYDDDHVDAARDGRFSVSREIDGVEHCAGIDATGKERVSLAPDCLLHIVPGAGWVRRPKREDATHADILDANGKLIRRIEGPGAWIREPGEDGIAIFSTDENNSGILDARTGRILIAAQDTLTFGESGEGRIAFSRTVGGEQRWGYLDYQGREVIAPKYQYAFRFRHGLAMVQLPADDRVEYEHVPVEKEPVAKVAVIDRAGQPLRALARLGPQHFEQLADYEQASPRLLVAKTSEGRAYVNERGNVIARVQQIGPCEGEYVRNAKGEIVWPRAPQAICAAREANEGVEKLSSDVQALHEEVAREEMASAREYASIEARGGGLQAIVDPEFARRQGVIDAAPWVHAPAQIRFGDVAYLTLPQGTRYLAPEDAAALEALLAPADKSVDRAAALRFGRIDGADGTWTARVRLVATGRVELEQRSLDHDALLDSLKARLVGRGYSSNPAEYAFVSWETAPYINLNRRALTWSVRYRQLAGGNATILRIVRFGRAHAVDAVVIFEGFASYSGLMRHQREIEELMHSVQFVEGERYEDSSPVESGASVEDFITSMPRDHYATDGPIHRQTSDIDGISVLAVLFLGVMGVLVFVVARSRRA